MIILTRQFEKSLPLYHKLSNLGVSSYIYPLFRVQENSDWIIKYLKYRKNIIPDLIIFTSQNAIRIFANSVLDRSMRIIVVSEVSKKIAHELGFCNVIKAKDNAKSIVKFIQDHNISCRNILYLTSNKQTMNMKNELVNHVVHIEQIELYKVLYIKKLDQELVKKIQENIICSVCFFSTYAAHQFSKLIQEQQSFKKHISLNAFVLSKKIYNEIKRYNYNKIIIADNFSENGMIKKITKY